EIGQIDFAKLIREGFLLVTQIGWYGLLLYVGDDNGRPIITFTYPQATKPVINTPDTTYLTTIVKGLKSWYNYTDWELLTYFSDKPGIKGEMSEDQLKQIIAKAA